ncbi:protein of unknown function DUF29 [Gloeothece citriformis PCC 7424]|uniref:DUF29 domain-containing protein n=1 Tax=Gloeothece citriformis (strain PCC 7424) TaxID=65393 RepID=B7KJQ5_GLOC7|nr:DUF29 domain-containing protein [Gloeothece citriformis]ACK69504.1 protein of unknown function DUF29 [Gloeothece citriformis PCC 7424]
MTTEILPKLKALYEEDFPLWIDEILKQLKSRNFEEVDWENLIEEVESLGREQKNKVEGYLYQLFRHLLLYQYWESEKEWCTSGWEDEIDIFRKQLNILVRSKTLYNYMLSIYEATYQDARRSVIRKTDQKIFPELCPYTVEKVLNSEWLP